MMILIGFLTLILVLICLLLMLLILIQLPKKDAGAGLAFGGGATEALFGAGSGTALTKLTKYIGTFFVGLSLFLAILNTRVDRGERLLERELERQAAVPGEVQPQPTAPPAAQSFEIPLPPPEE